MFHKDVLKILFPLELSGVAQTDFEIEGKALDLAQRAAEEILKEIFPDTAYKTLNNWERLCGFVSSKEEPLQYKRNKIIQKLRELGGLSIAYFIQLASSLGYSIKIEELNPFMCGWNRCGDPLYIEEARWIWRVKIINNALYYFRTGQSTAGERLLWWKAIPEIEEILRELKPAHTYVFFEYE